VGVPQFRAAFDIGKEEGDLAGRGGTLGHVGFQVMKWRRMTDRMQSMLTRQMRRNKLSRTYEGLGMLRNKPRLGETVLPARPTLKVTGLRLLSPGRAEHEVQDCQAVLNRP
jgi:hypothetical protein